MEENKTSKNKNLHQAKEAENDEFYTEISTIEKEMKNYKDYFKGKVVYCNCDDAKESNFFKYFSMNFEHLGLKKLITTGYKKGGKGVLLVYEGDKNGNRKVDDSEIITTELQGNGDFKSQECIEFLKEADVVVTNPPFSIWISYVKQLMNYGKNFLIIGNMNAITYKEIFPYIKNNELWLGVSLQGTKCSFLVPETYKGKNVFIEDGVRKAKVNNAIWFTNIPHDKRNQPLDLYKKYNPTDYKIYDNYCAINVDKVSDIPIDEYIEIKVKDEEISKWKATYGDDAEIIEENDEKRIKIKNPVYGVPITFLTKYCPDQFEIVSFRKGEDGNDLIFTREEEVDFNNQLLKKKQEFNLTFESLFDVDPRNDKKWRRKSEWENYLRKNNNKEKVKKPIDYFFPITTNLENGLVNDCTVKGKKTYVRILIRKKK